MNKICYKCKDSTKGGSTVVSGGKTYSFCKICTEILDSFESPGKILHIFLNPDKKQSKIDKNIFDARKRRAQGVLFWK